MTTNALPRAVTIDAVTKEFLTLQEDNLGQTDFKMYREVVRFFRLSVNVHAPSKFDNEERAFWHQYRVPGKGYSRAMSSLFGPEKTPGEVKYFFRHFLGKHAYVGEEFERRAPGILHEFFAWMVREKHIPELDIPKLFPEKKPRTKNQIEWTMEHAVRLGPRARTRTLLH